MSEKTLTIDLNEEYKIKREEPTDFKTSFFRDVYERAAKATADIIEQTSKLVDTKDAFQKERQEYNNIIAFTGDRGVGKTSAMVNYAQYLIKHQAQECKNRSDFFFDFKNTKFIGLPTIDPSLFEKDENIMEVMLAQMFSKFEDLIQQNASNIDLNTKRKILEQFEKVYENLQTIKKETKNYDGEAIETLSKMAGSTKLRENFRKLVLEYIALFTNSANNNIENKNCFLVIAIDDFDLNVKGAVEMSEQIRKYFMIPNVIILMAVNMAQLKDAKELSIRTEFKGIISHMEEHPSNMTLLYLLKLIPDNRRLLMPQIDKDTKISIENFTGIISELEKPIIYELINILSENPTLEEGTYRIINFYTGLIILPSTFNKKTNVNTHYNVIIYNMRKYVNLLVLIFKNMKIPIGKDEKLHNIKIFEQYFSNHIIENTIKDKIARGVITETVSYKSHRLNKFVINSLHTEFKRTLKLDQEPTASAERLGNTEIINKLLDPKCNSANLSLADVLYFANKYSSYFNNTEKDTFIDAIKMAYSIKMTKLVLNNEFDELQLILGDSILSKQLENQLITPDRETGMSRQIFPIEIRPDLRINETDLLSLLYFTPFWGSLKNHTNKRNDSNIYSRTIINGEKSSWFNIFSFLPLQLGRNSTINRLNNFIKNNITDSFDKTFLKHLDNQNNFYNDIINLPIYSIDFIENILNTHYPINSVDANNKYSICCEIILDIENRINTFWDYYKPNNALTPTDKRYKNNYFVNNFLENKSIQDFLNNNHDYELTIGNITMLINKSQEVINIIDEIRVKTTKNKTESLLLIKEICIEFEKIIPDTIFSEPFKNALSNAIYIDDIQLVKNNILIFHKKLKAIHEGKLNTSNYISYIEISQKKK
jgi:hypothetical protein